MRERSTVQSVLTNVASPVMDRYYKSVAEGSSWNFLEQTGAQDHWTGTAEFSECSDISTPNYKRRSASGEIINNPFLKRTVTDGRPGLTSFRHKTTNNGDFGLHGYDTYGSYAPFTWGGATYLDLLGKSHLSEIASARSNAINLAVTAAHANIDESEMLALATVAESAKTVRFFVETFRRLTSIIRKVRKLDLKGALGELSPKELAERYMELRYAVRPLIYDVNGMVASLKKERKQLRQTYRGWASDRVDHKEQALDKPYHYETVADFDRSLVYTVSARAGVLCNVTIDGLTPFGLDQFAETLWELTPFSFIVDWFANVGDTIGAWTPNSGVTQLSSWVTVKETFTSTNSLLNVRSTANDESWSAENFSTSSGFSWQYKEQVLERIVEPQLSVFPRWKMRIDAYKLLDLGIIAKGILR